jgi:hypothetical protein
MFSTAHLGKCLDSACISSRRHPVESFPLYYSTAYKPGLGQEQRRKTNLMTPQPSLIPGKGEVFSPLHVVQTGPGAHLASYPIGTWGSFPGGKAVRA